MVELKQRRSRELTKLRIVLNRIYKKLDQVDGEEEGSQGDVRDGAVAAAVHASKDEPAVPYYLLQPKATGGPPRHPSYLGAGEIKHDYDLLC